MTPTWLGAKNCPCLGGLSGTLTEQTLSWTWVQSDKNCLSFKLDNDTAWRLDCFLLQHWLGDRANCALCPKAQGWSWVKPFTNSSLENEILHKQYLCLSLFPGGINSLPGSLAVVASQAVKIKKSERKINLSENYINKLETVIHSMPVNAEQKFRESLGTEFFFILSCTFKGMGYIFKEMTGASDMLLSAKKRMLSYSLRGKGISC